MRLLRIVPDNTRFKIVRFRRFSYPFSALYSILTLVLFLTVGLNFGIDFRGGTLMEMQAKSGKPDIAQVRQTANAFGFGEVEVQEFGSGGELSMRFALQPGGEVAQQGVVTKARAALRCTSRASIIASSKIFFSSADSESQNFLLTITICGL